MIKKSDGKIGSREVFVLITFMTSLRLSDMTPTLLFGEGKTATWMIPIIAGAVMSVPFLILASLLKKYKDKGLIEIIYLLTGRYIGFIISFVLFALTLGGLVINSRDYADIISTMFMPRTPLVVILILLMAAVYFIANRGLEVIGRTAWFVFPGLTVILLILIYMVVKEVDMSYVYPFWGPGIKELVRTSVLHSSIVVDIIMFTVFFPFVRTYKDFKIPAIAGFVLSVAEMSGFYAIYIVVNDYPTVAHIMFPFHQITMLVHAGRYLINMEAFFLAFWVVASVVRYAMYLYLTAAIFTYTLRLKELEPLLLPFAALVVMLGMIPRKLIETEFVFRNDVLLQGSWVIFIFLPFILWTISKVRGDRVKCRE